MMMSTTASAPNTPSSSFFSAILLPALFRRPVSQDNFVANPVSHDCELVVIFQRQLNDLVDLFPRTHDSYWNHALANGLTFVHPRTLAGCRDGQAATDCLDLLVPNFVVTGSKRLPVIPHRRN